MFKKLLKVIIYVFLVIITFFTLFPVIHAILGAFKSNLELTTGGNIFPSKWVFSNFAEAWDQANFALYTFNSIFIAIFSTLGGIIISSMAGYAYSRRKFKGKKILMFLLVSTMFISIGAITLRPLYLLMVKLKIHRSLWSIIFITINTQATNILLVSRFVNALPIEIEEAAKIDGASTLKMFWKVVFPLLRPILGVVALFEFRNAWNSYIVPSIFTMNNPELRPLTVGVVSMKYTSGAAVSWNLMFAGAALSIIPMIIVFIFANKSFMSGITSGAVKG